MQKSSSHNKKSAGLKWFTFIMPDGLENTFQASDVNAAKRMAYRCIERTARLKAQHQEALERVRALLRRWKKDYDDSQPKADIPESLFDYKN